MISSNETTLFVSMEKFKVGNHLIDPDLVKLIAENPDKQKKLQMFALSFHNGFKTFDYSPIDAIEICNVPTRAIRLGFESQDGLRREIICDLDQRVYTKEKGFIDSNRVSCTDICIDSRGMYCKLVERENLGIVNVAMCRINVLYNHSMFINDILVKAQ